MQNCVKFLIIYFIAFSCQAKIVRTIFGDIDEQNPAILSILESDALLRLQHIDQSGPEVYFTDNYQTFSRYDHSLGVYAILKRFEVSENEQIAGLLHDASHTVFSHVADLVFQEGNMRTESYQDNIHAWYLKESGVESIVAKHNLRLEDVLALNPKYTALKGSYPDMNADRIEYNLHTGIVLRDITEQDAEDILVSLRYDNETWYFTDILNAKKFAKLSTYYTKSFWGSPRNVAMYTVAVATVKRALEKDIITKEDFHFGIDEDVVHKLNNCDDLEIKELIAMMEDIEKYYVPATKEDHHVFQPVKMRGINPLVLYDNDLTRLSALSVDYRNELDNTREYASNGVYIKFKNLSTPKLLNRLKSANL